MTQIKETDSGISIEGPLTVVAESDGAFILVGDEFLDELLRRRYAPRIGDLWREQPSLRLDRVRITIERVLAGQESVDVAEDGRTRTEDGSEEMNGE